MLIEVAIVRDQAFETIGPIAGDPIDHAGSVARAERADLVAIHPRALDERGCQGPGRCVNGSYGRYRPSARG